MPCPLIRRGLDFTPVTVNPSLRLTRQIRRISRSRFRHLVPFAAPFTKSLQSLSAPSSSSRFPMTSREPHSTRFSRAAQRNATHRLIQAACACVSGVDICQSMLDTPSNRHAFAARNRSASHLFANQSPTPDAGKTTLTGNCPAVSVGRSTNGGTGACQGRGPGRTRSDLWLIGKRPRHLCLRRPPCRSTFVNKGHELPFYLGWTRPATRDFSGRYLPHAQRRWTQP